MMLDPRTELSLMDLDRYHKAEPSLKTHRSECHSRGLHSNLSGIRQTAMKGQFQKHCVKGKTEIFLVTGRLMNLYVCVSTPDVQF